MKNKFTIGVDGFSLPQESITSTFGILAKRGAGKSNTAAVMAEGMYDCDLPFVVIDPVGAWWGLRSGKDGTPDGGIPIPIFGGAHGDLPLERTGGELIADLVIDKRLSCILDLTDFDSEAAKKQFLLGFAQRLFAKNRDPLHLFLEEADDYIPQSTQRGEEKLLRAMENLVRRGRSKCGLGMTMISQRSASIHKGVLTQCDTLIVMRTTSPQDRVAIEEWIKYHDVDKGIVKTLSALGDGEAWVWSPEFLKTTERVQVRRRRTFDSGATPKNIRVSESQKVATLADINLGELSERMAATVEAHKENDPKELKKRIAELERELRKKEPTGVPEAEVERLKIVARTDGFLSGSRKALESGISALQDLLNGVAAKTERRTELQKPAAIIPKDIPANVVTSPVLPAQRIERPLQNVVIKSATSANGAIKPALYKVLFVLAQQDRPLSRKQIAILSGYSPNSGGFNSTMAAAIKAGWITPDNPTSITSDGRSAVGPVEALPTGAELHNYWVNRLKTAEGRILRTLIEGYPEEAARSNLAETCGYSANSGGFNSACAKLVALDLAVKTSGGLRAAEELF